VHAAVPLITITFGHACRIFLGSRSGARGGRRQDGAEILFPEFQHGQRISLEGVVTRGNEMTNTIGFQYSGHILTCRPRRGSIVRFKRHLFLRCLIIGKISRLDEHGGTTNPRPQIVFDDLQIKEDDGGQPSLL